MLELCPLPAKDKQGQYKNGIMKRLTDLIVYLALEDKLETRLAKVQGSTTSMGSANQF